MSESMFNNLLLLAALIAFFVGLALERRPRK